MTTNKRKGPPWPLIIVMAAFLVPAAIAWTLFFSGWRPSSLDNNGEILTPPHKLEGQLRDETGSYLDPDVLRGKWTILVVSRGPCESDCQELLVQTRQTRLALAQHAERSRRVLLLPEDVPGLNEQLQAEHRDLTVYRGLDVLPMTETPAAEAPLHVSLVDTGGFRMMAYAEPLDAGGLLHDMKKLIRISNRDLERLQGVSEEN